MKVLSFKFLSFKRRRRRFQVSGFRIQAALLLLITCHLSLVTRASADNTNVTNPPSRPVNVHETGSVTTIALPVRGAPTDKSGTITTGGSSQTLAAANAARSYIEIQNISDETMYINFGATATVESNSFKLVAGASYVNPPQFCPNGTITIIGATTGKKFIAKEG